MLNTAKEEIIMNIKQLAQYDNEKKSSTVAYILGAISWVIPMGLHKFYLGHNTAGWLYVAFGLVTYLVYVKNNPTALFAMGILSIAWVISMLVDAFTTRGYVKGYNRKLMDRLEGDEYEN